MELRPSRPIEDGDAIEIVEPLCAVFRRMLKDDGQKYTPSRAWILDTIIELDSVFTAEALLSEVNGTRTERVSKATVYRTLELLDQYGIIERLPFDREQSHYQLVYGKRADALLIDVDTGEAETIEAPELIELRDKICAARGITPEGHRLQIYVRSGA
ncbi:MAG: transcriptional repressor [Planctomycetota bacterium]